MNALESVLAAVGEPGRRVWVNLDGEPRARLFRLAVSSCAGATGWLPEHGGLLANLRGWENCVLPHSYYCGRPGEKEETALDTLLSRLGVPEANRRSLMGAQIHALTAQQRRQLVVVRTLLSRPALILAEAEWFGHIGPAEAAVLAGLFAEEGAKAAWLVIGPLAPSAVWGAFEPMEVTHEPAAR